MKVVQFSVPLPASRLSPNRVKSDHWRTTSNAKKKWIAELEKHLVGHQISIPRFNGRVSIQYEFYCGYLYAKTSGRKKRVPDGKYRPKDADNALGAMKCFQDWLVRSGYIQSDDAHTLTLMPPTIIPHRDADGNRGVLVTIRKVEQ